MKTTNQKPISPRALRALRQRGLDPAAIRGSGPGGRIVEADVLRAQPTQPQASAGQPAPGGLLTPEVQQRLMKLWSHRVGAVAHEAVRRP